MTLMLHLNHFFMSFADSLYIRRTIQLCRFTTLEIICYSLQLNAYNVGHTVTGLCSFMRRSLPPAELEMLVTDPVHSLLEYCSV